MIGVQTNNSLPISLSINDCFDNNNGASFVPYVINGASGKINVDFRGTKSYPTASAIIAGGSYVITNHSAIGRQTTAALTGNQSLANVTTTILAFAAITTDTLGATLSGNSLLLPTIAQLGNNAGVNRVKITAGADFEANATGVRVLNIYKNATLVGSVSVNACSAGGTQVAISSIVVSCAPGDYFTAYAYQNSTIALNVLNSANTYLSVEAAG
jgi:hypothetical protein